MDNRREQFAAFLERLANNEVTLDDWNYYAVAHYLDEELETIRCDVVRLAIAKNGGPYSGEDQQLLMSWHKQLLGENA
jgi:hypothetical protein